MLALCYHVACIWSVFDMTHAIRDPVVGFLEYVKAFYSRGALAEFIEFKDKVNDLIKQEHIRFMSGGNPQSTQSEPVH